MSNDRTYRPSSTRTKAVAAFYEKHPYPDPAPDLEAFRKGEGTLLGSPSHFSDLLWPGKASPSPLNILIAGCGTSQAAKYALLNPDAIVTGIDLSEASLAHTQRLADRYALRNLTIHRLPIEKAPELATRYDLIVSTGVLHHMPDPQVGLNALTTVLRDEGVMHLMVYARYGRTGVYMMQELCERLHVHPEDESIADLQRLSRSLPQTHPLNMFSRRTDDLQYAAGVADALMHPQDRAFTVPQIQTGLTTAGLRLDRWLLQAPYLTQCAQLEGLPRLVRSGAPTMEQGHAVMELVRGTMLTHEFTAVKENTARALEFKPEALNDKWLRPFPGSKCNLLGLPPGIAGQLWHPSHGYTDLMLSLDQAELAQFRRIGDGISFTQFSDGTDASAAASFCQRLWEHDQILIGKAG